MEPDQIQYDLIFYGFTQFDNRNLTALTLFAGSTSANYSDQLDSSFTLERDGFTIEVEGTDFVYSGGVPTGGMVDSMVVRVGNAIAYQWGDLDLGEVAYPFSIFTSSDPLAIAGALFAGNDLINGSPQGDTIFGFTGDDQINASSGQDRIYGEDGNDQLNGGRQDDRLFGGNGDDWLSGDQGDDVLKGGEGSDTANYYRVSPAITVKLKNEKPAKAKIGFNEVDKLKSVENVVGGLAADKLTGDRGNNKLDGDAGNDVLMGKGGNDTLSGDYGYDTLTGGKGDDIFWFDKLLAGHGFTNIDTITDFGNGNDSIHLRQLIFGELMAGVLSPENFLAAPGAFAGLNGQQYIIYNSTDGALYYDSSGDGTGLILQFATLQGAPQLTAANFFVVEEPIVI